MDPEVGVEIGENHDPAVGLRATFHQSDPVALEDDEFVAADHEIRQALLGTGPAPAEREAGVLGLRDADELDAALIEAPVEFVHTGIESFEYDVASIALSLNSKARGPGLAARESDSGDAT